MVQFGQHLWEIPFLVNDILDEDGAFLFDDNEEHREVPGIHSSEPAGTPWLIIYDTESLRHQAER